MEYIPDNFDFYDEYEAEQARRHRLLKRLACAVEMAERDEAPYDREEVEPDGYFVSN